MPQGLQSFQPGFWSCVLVLRECWVPLPLLWTGRSFLGSDSLHTGWSVLCCNLKGDPFSGLLWSFKNLCVILTQGHSNLSIVPVLVLCAAEVSTGLLWSCLFLQVSLAPGPQYLSRFLWTLSFVFSAHGVCKLGQGHLLVLWELSGKWDGQLWGSSVSSLSGIPIPRVWWAVCWKLLFQI